MWERRKTSIMICHRLELIAWTPHVSIAKVALLETISSWTLRDYTTPHYIVSDVSWAKPSSWFEDLW